MALLRRMPAVSVTTNSCSPCFRNESIESRVVPGISETTRDSIDSFLKHGEHEFVVTDTAGIRRKSAMAQKVEAYSVIGAMRSIDEAEVVACLLDAGEAGVE